MNDKRRLSGACGASIDSGARNSAGGSGAVPPRGLRTNWGRELHTSSSLHLDSTLAQSRPDIGVGHHDDVPTHALGRSSSRENQREPRIAILGCGPAGLLAAHAVRLHGFRPDILSIPDKSELSGAIYLHAPIPYLTTDVKTAMVQYAKIGTREGYAEKVYGYPEALSSWDLYDGQFQAYSMKQAYDLLWIKYQHMIKGVDFARHSTPELITQDYQVVINTIPAPVLCMSKEIHTFVGQEILVYHSLPEKLLDNTIFYNGVVKEPWYRASKIFGVESTEYATDKHEYPLGPEADGASKGMKPIENNCDCNPRFHRVGRFGRWQKGVLAHEAFTDTISIMESEGIVDALF